MDPASAAVAVLGLAASVAQLTSMAIASCKTLHSFCRDTSDAPDNVDRLLRLLQKLELVTERLYPMVASLGHSTGDGVTVFWQQHAVEMKRDIQVFRDKVAKLERGFRAKDRPLKTILARMRVVFSNDETARYERVFSSHVETATLMLSMTTRVYSQAPRFRRRKWMGSYAPRRPYKKLSHQSRPATRYWQTSSLRLPIVLRDISIVPGLTIFATRTCLGTRLSRKCRSQSRA
ncbi:hypothetical protein LTR53_008402 [Teratosphaeriaceae sp. CCFEE 6253]|nr:hypothetical protein LTR53_008402 [Teratosphaeriaceae sp. CCFEE 6253]